MASGITAVHRRSCNGARAGNRCTCTPGYRVQVWDPHHGKLIRKTFRVLAEAKSWRDDLRVGIRRGTVRPSTRETIAQEGEALIAGMKDETILDRTGKPYKPATIRTYEQGMNQYVVPALGKKILSDLRRQDVQDFIDELRRKGLAPSTIANKLDPLRVICRRAVRRDELAIDPTKELEIPANRGKRDRIAAPPEAARLIAAVPLDQRAFWSTAFYAGLRRGELRALRWSHVDFEAGLIRVERGWDDKEGEIDLKTDAGRRVVPMIGGLRKVLAAHKLATGRNDDGLVFGRTADLPFVPTTVRSAAYSAWGWKQKRTVDPVTGKVHTTWVKAREDALRPLSPHEARHCAASYLIAAGLNEKQLSVYMGHSDIRTTYNKYGHLMPGDEASAAQKLGDFLDEAERAG